MEIWKVIPGYSAYEASTAGRIKRVAPAKTRTVPYILRAGFDTKGYQRVKLVSDDGVKKIEKVHRLILIAHVGPPPFAKAQGCHNNGEPSDCSLTNLRWDSCAGNQADRVRHGTSNKGPKNGRAKLNVEQVAEIRAQFKGRYGQVSALSRQYGVSNSQMWEICHARSW